MRKLNLLARLIELLTLLATLIIFILAPIHVVTHFNDFNHPDAFGNRIYLFLPAIIQIVVSELSLAWARHLRRKNTLTRLPMLLPRESRLLGILLVLAVVMVALTLQQSRYGY